MKAALDALLSQAADAGDLPGVIAAVADTHGTRYEGAFGLRNIGQPERLRFDDVFWIASLTKAITATAAMQLVERGRLQLDAPVANVVPEFGRIQVLEGFDAAGEPRLRAPRSAITLRHLLTHTSGLGYEFVQAELLRYCEKTGTPGTITLKNATLMKPLVCDPGTSWNYGVSIDWVGKLIEAVSGTTLGGHLRTHVLAPLGMRDTSFALDDARRARRFGMHARLPDGSLAPIPFETAPDAEFEMGGGGLYGTAVDYMRFLRMLLGGGALDGVRLLEAETVRSMGVDQIPALACGRLPSALAQLTQPAELLPAEDCGWGLSFLLNRKPVAGGRAVNSLAWAGLANCYYWVDPTNGVTALLATQILPFYDLKTIRVLEEFEHSVYSDASA